MKSKPRRRSLFTGVGLAVTTVAVAGGVFMLDPIAGGASSHRRADSAPEAAHVPIEAALVSRARAEAEQKVVAAMVAQQQQQLAAFYAAAAAQLQPKTGVNWDGIAQCETAGNWRMQGSTFSGGLGFYNGTWTGFGGRQFAANAGQASREQQIVVAERVYARYGLSGWGCRAYG
ncbi:MAG: transglycosylase family protein [Acidimicrobiia bacterium]